MTKFLGGAISGVLLFSGLIMATPTDAKAAEQIEPDQPFHRTITLDEENLTQGSSVITLTDGDHTPVDLSSEISGFRAGKQLEFRDSVNVDLNKTEEVMDAEETAKSQGNELNLAAVTVKTQYADSSGNVLTASDIEEMVEETGSVTFVNPAELGIGNDPSVKEIKKWEKEMKKKAKEGAKTPDNSTASLSLIRSGSYAYTYLNSYIYVYEEWSGSQKRNYFYGKFDWPVKAYAGDVRNSASDYVANETIMLAWDRGPNSMTGKRANLVYEYMNSSTKRTVTNPTRHQDDGPHAAAFKFNALPSYGGVRHVIRSAQIYSYSGWYNPSSYGDQGDVEATYIEGTKSVLPVGFSISLANGSLGVSWSSTTNYEFADVYTTYR